MKIEIDIKEDKEFLYYLEKITYTDILNKVKDENSTYKILESINRLLESEEHN